jgi:archaetidylinositol phosphate synthase
MVLDQARKLGDFFMVPLAKLFINVNPNYITVVSFLFAVGAGISFMIAKPLALSSEYWKIPPVLIIGALFVVLSGIFDLLDGKVARMADKVTVKGDFLDHMFDRYSDAIIIIGIVFSGYCIVGLGVIALGSILIASYMGTQAQALGLGRDYKGIMGRADRIFLLIFFPLIHLVIFFIFEDANLIWFEEINVYFLEDLFDYINYRFTILDVLMIIFIVGGQWTAIQRAFDIWESLGEREEGEKKQKKISDKKKNNKD